MANLTSPVLQQLLKSTRTQLNQQDPTNSFWSDSELTEYLNDAVSRFFVECANVNEGHFTTQTDLNIVANTATIALPTDCFEVKNVWKKMTDGYQILQYSNIMQDNTYSNTGAMGDTYYPHYRFQGNNLVLNPVPSSSETGGLRLEYIQFPTTMVNGGDSLTNQISPVFKELIIMYAVYKAKLRESMVNGGNMYQIPAQQVADLASQFKSAIVKRSKNPTFVKPYNPESEGY